MCGIVGFVGRRNAVPVLLEGLKRLEYRGYDSAGVAVLLDGQLQIRKCVGRLRNLEQQLQQAPLAGAPGIGHTRWATHGEPSDVNSHPHTDSSGRIAVVHNGIIENYQELRRELEQKGHIFRSETDTEVIPHLIENELADGAANFEDAVRRALRRARGAYALGILFADDPEILYAARHGSPLIVGVGDGEHFIASDVPAILNETSRVIYLNDGEIAVLKADGASVFTLDGRAVRPEIKKVEFQAEAIERAGFETFMMKEIHEQPRVLRSLIAKHIDSNGHAQLPGFSLADEYIKGLARIMIVSCGTAYHAGMYGRLLFENLAHVPVETDLASEFRYRNPMVDPGTLIIAVSQSGETADTLASVRLARKWGCKVLSICNVRGSTLTRESDAVFYTEAGPEIGVASTKAYTAQLMAFCLLTLHIARIRGTISDSATRELARALQRIPDAVHYVLGRKDDIQKIAGKHHDGPSSLYLGRKYNYPTALEGALKNKEISYQHAEGYAAGEMKHGPIALINEYLPVVCICTRTEDEVYDKMISNIKEVEARHGRIIAVATENDRTVAGLAEDVISVPDMRDEFSPIVNIVALQLLAYYAAQARGTDIDKPRNLAKSVTVE
ncbi:MAG: Glutamine--fructose-6-phosphate aminotransferase (isomerizing) [Verrucomicrobia bacterium ADurb.Bin345]|nr:MAG: Glutamine--fructose-6-phosphate aminotransferase (isomerizing) [Verrucomicrobia bacterium ADurb.Bin345]